jgi:hypothetical protein
MRLLAMTAAMVGGLAMSASAQEATTGRYEIEASVDGFVRLDTETGAVSHCRRRDDVWRCEILAEDRSAIDAVAAELKALNDRLDVLSARLDAVEAAGAKVAAPPPEAPVEPEPGFAEQLIRSLFQLVRDLKGERQASS